MVHRQVKKEPEIPESAFPIICGALKVEPDELENITVMKKGMTNHSFLFSCRGQRYILRIPGEGTDRLVSRRQEAAVYQGIFGRHISDDVVYINPENGYKITRFLEGARVCSPMDKDDVRKCMEFLSSFHRMGISAGHEFDIFRQIEYYESLREPAPSVYPDYLETKEKVLSLKAYIDAQAPEKVLAHMDAVPDNFLFITVNGREEIRLIDWEYAGMQDPHADIAMFCIYAMYDRRHADMLIADYFQEGCSKKTRYKIYCYIAACGLLWSNWCEYKKMLGAEFGEYAARQYLYAKEYSREALRWMACED